MSRLVIVSLDLMLALPFLSIAFAILFSSMMGSQNYLLAFSGLENKTLNLMVTSQQIASAIDSSQINYSVASQTALRIAKRSDGVTATITGLDAESVCQSALEVCRLVTVSGSSQLLVVSYANSS